MSLYKNILTSSWKISWRNKSLWFFGLFALLLGVGGEFEILINGANGELKYGLISGLKNFIQSGLLNDISFADILAVSKQAPFSMLMILVIGVFVLAMFVFLVWLVNVSQIALVKESVNISEGKATKKYKIQKGVEVGMKNFWPVFSFNLILKVLIYIVFVIFFWFLGLSIVKGAGLISSIIYTLMFIVFIPLAISFSFIVKYAIAYVVVKGEKFGEALKQGWVLFSKNWLISIEMAFVLYFIFFVATVLFIIIQFNLMIAFTFLAYVLSKVSAVLAFWVFYGIQYFVALLVALLIGAITATFQISAWTLLFLELTTKGATSKIARVFEKK